MWYLYVLRCEDGSLYAGATNDVLKRFEAHREGRGARYTRAHPPVEVLAAWQYPDRPAALSAEAHFKALPRAAKDVWVEGRWPFKGGPCAFDLFDVPAAHRFCPRCGGHLVLPDDEEHVPVCAACGRQHYLNAKPCAGVLILHEGHVLLVHRAVEPYLGYWDIPGGFLEPEESPEAGALREAREETGMKVQIHDFLGFYMDHYEYQGERSPTLNIYFVVEACGEPHAGDDADGLRWFPLDALPEKIAFDHEPQVLADLQRWARHKEKERVWQS